MSSPFDEDETPLTQAHRYAKQAEEAEAKESWQTAIDKHTRASQCFKRCFTRTSGQAAEALELLFNNHQISADNIRVKLANSLSSSVHHLKSQQPLHRTYTSFFPHEIQKNRRNKETEKQQSVYKSFVMNADLFRSLQALNTRAYATIDTIEQHWADAKISKTTSAADIDSKPQEEKAEKQGGSNATILATSIGGDVGKKTAQEIMAEVEEKHRMFLASASKAVPAEEQQLLREHVKKLSKDYSLMTLKLHLSEQEGHILRQRLVSLHKEVLEQREGLEDIISHVRIAGPHELMQMQVVEDVTNGSVANSSSVNNSSSVTKSSLVTISSAVAEQKNLSTATSPATAYDEKCIWMEEKAKMEKTLLFLQKQLEDDRSLNLKQAKQLDLYKKKWADVQTRAKEKKVMKSAGTAVSTSTSSSSSPSHSSSAPSSLAQGSLSPVVPTASLPSSSLSISSSPQTQPSHI